MINESKINRLVQKPSKGLVLLSSWLLTEGYSYELQQRYRKSGWLKSIGHGAMIRTGDPLSLSGAISALQTQADSTIHIGGRSALELLGLSHYLQVNSREVTIFADGRFVCPSWFIKNKWDLEPKLNCLTIFDDFETGLVDYQDGELIMKISSATRAMIECLLLAPHQFSLYEAYEIMEGLTTLKPKQVQELLIQCKSIKVKRLFLYFAEKAGHSWFKHIDVNNIDLGAGNRSLVTDGVLVSKYQLVLPKDLV